MPEQNYNPEQLKDMLKSMDLTSKRAQFFKNQISQAGADLQQLEQIFKSIVAEQDKLNQAFEFSKMSYAELREIGTEMIQEQGKKINLEKIAQKSLGKTLDLQLQLNAQLEGQVSFSDRELQTKKRKLRFLQEEQRSIANTIAKNKNILKAGETLRDLTGDRINKLQNITKEEAAILKAAAEGNIQEDSTIQKIERELALRKQIRNTLGATGAILDGVAGVADKLGMKGLSDDIKDIKEDIEDSIRENIADLNAKLTAAGRNSATFSDKMGLAAKNIGAALKGIGQMGAMIVGQLLNPINLVVASLAKVTDAFFSLDAAEVDFSRLTGRAAKNFATMNNNLVLGKDVLETMSDLTRDLGLDAMAIFDPQEVAKMAEMSKFLGLSAKETGNMAKMTAMSGLSAEQFEKSIEKGYQSTARTTKSAIPLGVVMKDVYSVSDELANVLDNNPERISAAATAARGLGLDLNRVDQIASGLLDFESSINAELEAQLLTGKALNLSKARELALNNDLEGLANEIKDNVGIQGAFASKNRVQQEAVAKALGMSRGELAKSYAIQQLNAGVTAEQLAATTGMTAQQIKQLSVQDKLNLVTGKLAEAFAPLLDILHPVADVMLFISKTISFGVANTIGLVTQSERFKATMTSVKDTVSIIGEKISSFFGDEETSPLAKFGAGIGALLGGGLLVASGKKLLGMVTKKMGLGGGRGIKDARVDSDGSLFVKIKGMASSVGDLLTGGKGKGGMFKGLSKVLGKIPGMGGASKMMRGMAAKALRPGMFKGASAAGGGMASKLATGAKGMASTAMAGAKGMGGKAATGVMGMLGKAGSAVGGLASKAGGALSKMNPMNLLKSGIAKNAMKILKIPIITSLIEGFFAKQDIEQMIAGASDKNTLFQSVGTRVAEALGSVGGASIGGALGSIIPGGGTILGALGGEMLGRHGAKMLAETLGADKLGKWTIDNLFPEAKKAAPIPLATGGILSSATNAIVGEAGAEAVVPLTEFYKKMEEQTTAIVEAVLANKDVYFDTAKVTAATAMNNYRR